MRTKNTVDEFLKTVDNNRRFARMLYWHIKGPKEKPHKVFTLDDLMETGKARLKDIATKTGQSVQNLCIVYNSLEKQGLVTREVDPADKRNTYYSITPKGANIVVKNKGKARKVIEGAFEALSDEELIELKESLEKSNKIMEKVMEQVS